MIAKCTGAFLVGKAPPGEFLIVTPLPPAAAKLNARLARPCLHFGEDGAEPVGRLLELHDVWERALVNAGGDLALAPAHGRAA